MLGVTCLWHGDVTRGPGRSSKTVILFQARSCLAFMEQLSASDGYDLLCISCNNILLKLMKSYFQDSRLTIT